MQIHPCDNVEVRLDGQKYALCDIHTGECVTKYGFLIGEATKEIPCGDQVSPENLRSRLSGLGEWTYEKGETSATEGREGFFEGYLRANGAVGIRNELWIVPTVGCINDVARTLAEKCGGKALVHPYGCSQLGGDLLTTQRILCGLIRHPNAGGVLVLGLGCENNRMEDMKRLLGEIDETRVRFLSLQDCEDETEEGLRLIGELYEEWRRIAASPFRSRGCASP